MSSHPGSLTLSTLPSYQLPALSTSRLLPNASVRLQTTDWNHFKSNHMSSREHLPCPLIRWTTCLSHLPDWELKSKDSAGLHLHPRSWHSTCDFEVLTEWLLKWWMNRSYPSLLLTTYIFYWKPRPLPAALESSVLASSQTMVSSYLHSSASLVSGLVWFIYTSNTYIDYPAYMGFIPTDVIWTCQPFLPAFKISLLSAHL